jgi:hypothetical protein
MRIYRDQLESAIPACLSIIESRIIYNEELYDIIIHLDADTFQDFYVKYILGSKALSSLVLQKDLCPTAENFREETAVELGNYKKLKSSFESLKKIIDDKGDSVALTDIVDHIRDCIHSTFERKMVLQEVMYKSLYALAEAAAGKNKKIENNLYKALTNLKSTLSAYNETSYYRVLLELFPFQSEFVSQIETFIKFIPTDGLVSHLVELKAIMDWRAICMRRLNDFVADIDLNSLFDMHLKQLNLLQSNHGGASSNKADHDLNELSTINLLQPGLRLIFHIQVKIEQKLQALESNQVRRNALMKKRSDLVVTERDERGVLNKALLLSHKKFIHGLTQCANDLSKWNEVLMQQRVSVNEDEARMRLTLERNAQAELLDLEESYRTELSQLMPAFKRTFSQALRLSEKATEAPKPLSPNQMHTLDQIYQFGTSSTMPNIAFQEIEALIEALGGRKQTGKTTGSHRKYKLSRMELHIIEQDDDAQSAPEHSLTLVKPHKGSDKHVKRLTLRICYEIFKKVGVFKLLTPSLAAVPAVSTAP